MPKTTEGDIKSEQEQFNEAKTTFKSAQNIQQRLEMMDHNIDLLNQSGWSSTGTGAQSRMSALKGINSFFRSVGMNEPFDPNRVAAWEDLNKESTRAGFELAKTLGSREAMMIVQQATAAECGKHLYGSKAGFLEPPRSCAARERLLRVPERLEEGKQWPH
jgi:hypothetical protein